MTKMLTLFAAIKLPPHIVGRAADLQKNIDGVRWAPLENFHITLGYFGLVDEDHAEALDHALARPVTPAKDEIAGGFRIHLEGVGVFGGSRPHTLWLGVGKSASLIALHKHVRKAARAANIPMEARKFTPHLSLAYMRGGISLADLTHFVSNNMSFSTPPFMVDQFGLFASNPQTSGPNIYSHEANFPLLGGPKSKA